MDFDKIRYGIRFFNNLKKMKVVQNYFQKRVSYSQRFLGFFFYYLNQFKITF